jgi:hypothetical protein
MYASPRLFRDQYFIRLQHWFSIADVGLESSKNCVGTTAPFDKRTVTCLVGTSPLTSMAVPRHTHATSEATPTS